MGRSTQNGTIYTEWDNPMYPQHPRRWKWGGDGIANACFEFYFETDCKRTSTHMRQCDGMKSVLLQEGDIVFTRYRGSTSRVIACMNHGMSHVGIVLTLRGKLCYVHSSPTMERTFPQSAFLPNCHGEVVRKGVNAHILSTETFRAANHVWVFRLETSPSNNSLLAMRLKAETMMDANTPPYGNYAAMQCGCFGTEHVNSMFERLPRRSNRYTCSQAVACILEAGGIWHWNVSVMPIHLIRRLQGSLQQEY